MTWIQRLFRRRQVLQDLSEEIEQHISERAEELIRDGMPSAEAFQTARKEFGNVTLFNEESREVWGGQFWETLAGDLRYAARQLRKSKGFATAVILTLAIAIGANTAIFSAVRSVLLQPLHFADPGRLLCLWRGDGENYPWYTFSYPRFSYFEQRLTSIAELAAYDDETVTFSDHSEPAPVEGGRVTSNFFSVLGITPQIGRGFLASEDHHGAAEVVLLSDRFWRERYHADPKIIGHAVVIDGEEFTVIGVLPRGFQFQRGSVDLWRSRIVDTRTFAPTSVRLGATYLTVIARLRPGVTLSRLRAELAVLAERYRQENPDNSDILGPVSGETLQQKLFSTVHMTLLVLWGAVACLLVIACANVANLVLARATARDRDVRVRVALGASRWRITQQLVTESVFLSVCSVFLSLPLSAWGMRAVVSALQAVESSVPDVHLDVAVTLCTFVVAIAIGVLFGLIGLGVAGLGKGRSGIHSGERGSSASMWSTQLRNSIVAGQVAVCLVLLAAAGLLTRSFIRMATMSTGLRADHTLMVSLDLMPDRYGAAQERVNFYDEVLRRVGTIPGVRAAAIASKVNLVSSGLGYMLQLEGAPDLGSRNPGASGRSVSPSYFRVVGIPLLKGRMFTDHDTSTSSRVIIINEAFARRFFPDINPLGKHIIYSTDRINCEVVGVVGNVRSGVQDTGVDEELYLPLSQRPWLVAKLLVRTNTSTGIAGAIRSRIQAVDPQQAVANVVPLEQVISENLGRPRTAMLAVTVFAGSALFLAAVGIYGVIAYSVAQRRKEIGIRMALGADTHRVKAMIFRQTSRLLGFGLIAGVPLALLLSRLYTSLLFAVEPGDPETFVGVIGVLFAVAFIASYLPAVRAAKVEPAIVLRID
ncbi:MAG: ABC transporter permease [Acidobacteriaceae bacterium]|nr:ABC transporter permease [Acidobacteriaceae bacterium]MBV9498416.1 ABC transporter permease [Acidobacteriaceae bacterium]